MTTELSVYSRGSGPVVSILMPTRNRTRLLGGAIESYISLASSPKDLEFILKVDEDDHHTQDNLPVLAHLIAPGSLKTIMTPRGKGYADIPLWIGLMLKQAEGDWISFSGDDQRMLTPGWDQSIAKMIQPHADDLMCILGTIVGRDSNECFFIRKKVFDLLPDFPPNTPHLDTWIISVLMLLDRVVKGKIEMVHFNSFMGDQVAIDRKTVAFESYKGISTASAAKERIEAAKILVGYMKECES